MKKMNLCLKAYEGILTTLVVAVLVLSAPSSRAQSESELDKELNEALGPEPVQVAPSKQPDPLDSQLDFSLEGDKAVTPSTEPVEEIQAETPVEEIPADEEQPAVVESAPTSPTHGSSDTVEDYRNTTSGLVEKYYPIEYNAHYKQRRGDSGAIFGITYENILMDGYDSIIDTTLYEDMFGKEEIPIYQIQLGYKYNIPIGALVFGAGVGYGTITSAGSGYNRSLEITKYNLYGSYIADMLFDEPYVAPYATFGAMILGLNETSDVSGETETVKGQSQTAYNYQVGLLLQLNWLDEEGALSALKDFGMENTYLDVFVNQYTNSSSPDDPKLATAWNIGAGLKLEF